MRSGLVWSANHSRKVQSVPSQVDRAGGVDTDEFAVPGVAQDLSVARPAAPMPEMTTEQSSALSMSLRLLVSPARVTTAVPCWSSWKTGMSRRSFSVSSMVTPVRRCPRG